MVGKMTALFVKKEAEAYCAQGLHKEAMNLFSGLLAGAKEIDPAIQAAIKSKLKGIRQEMQTTEAQRQRALCAEEIRRIRDGWGDKATEADNLVCAQAFYEIGAYDEALRELEKLLGTRDAKRIHLTAAANCLMRLHLPEPFPAAAEALAREVRSKDKQVWAILMAMAKHLEAEHHRAHALALYRHLALVPELAASMQPRIAALSGLTSVSVPAEFAPESALPDPAPHPIPDPMPPVAHSRFSLKRLSALFKKKPA